MKYITYIQALQKLILAKYTWKTYGVMLIYFSIQPISNRTEPFYQLIIIPDNFHAASEIDYTGKSGYIAVQASVDITMEALRKDSCSITAII